MIMQRLTELTTKLVKQLESLKQRYEKNDEQPKNDRAFFEFVKNETEPIFTLIEEWEGLAQKFVEQQGSFLHSHQITSTRENMEALLLHSYYVDTRKRSYMELYKSCYYIYDQLLQELQNENKTL